MNKPKWEIRHLVVDDALIEAGDIYSIIGPVYWSGNIYEGLEQYEKSLESFSVEQRNVFAAMWYIDEVNNGGHDQFYYNSTEIVWPDALTGFEAMGMDEVATILKESVARMGGNPSREREARWEELENCRDVFSEPFSDLDRRFYALEQALNIEEAMLNYIKRHRKEFYFDGQVNVPIV